MIVGTWPSGKDDGCTRFFSCTSDMGNLFCYDSQQRSGATTTDDRNSRSYSFDNTCFRSYCYIHGGAAVRRGTWTFVLFLLIAVACVSAIPRTDLPETSYNEVDIPVNQAPPVVPGVRFVRPAIAPVVLPRQVCEAGLGIIPPALEWKAAYTPVRRDPHSLQDLLCTFLI